ncbi:hypothetical protein V8G54_008151, partial [Vigna mungo]
PTPLDSLSPYSPVASSAAIITGNTISGNNCFPLPSHPSASLQTPFSITQPNSPATLPPTTTPSFSPELGLGASPQVWIVKNNPGHRSRCSTRSRRRGARGGHQKRRRLRLLQRVSSPLFHSYPTRSYRMTPLPLSLGF